MVNSRRLDQCLSYRYAACIKKGLIILNNLSNFATWYIDTHIHHPMVCYFVIAAVCMRGHLYDSVVDL